MNTVAEIRRLASWATELTDRRSAGQPIPAEDLVEYQRAKVALLAAIARRDRTVRARAVLDEARQQLAQMEAA